MARKKMLKPRARTVAEKDLFRHLESKCVGCSRELVRRIPKKMNPKQYPPPPQWFNPVPLYRCEVCTADSFNAQPVGMAQ